MRVLAFACGLIIASAIHGNASEVWRCSMRITKPTQPPKYPNTDYDAFVLDKAESADVFWQKPGRFVIWKPPGGDLINTYRVVEDSPAKLAAALDVERVMHSEMTIDKRNRYIRIVGGPAVGDIRVIEEGSCAPPRHEASPLRSK